MEDRIKIGDEWYVRETLKEDSREIIESVILEIEGCDMFRFSAIKREDNRYYGQSVEVIDKLSRDVLESWDSDDFLRGLSKRNPSDLELVENYSQSQINDAIILIEEAIKLGYL